MGKGGELARRVTAPVVAVLPWGDVWEDFFDTIGIPIEEFFTGMGGGGWLLGYVEALERFGIRTVLVVWSREARRPHRRVHAPTGTAVWVLPPGRMHRAARRLRRHAKFLRIPGWLARRLDSRRLHGYDASGPRLRPAPGAVRGRASAGIRVPTIRRVRSARAVAGPACARYLPGR
jgi:hypothetical protein